MPRHELVGHDGTITTVYSPEQLDAIHTEHNTVHSATTPAERTLLADAIEHDGYRRLNHAFANPRSIDAGLARHIIEHLGQRPDPDQHHDPDHIEQWDAHVAATLTEHAHTGRHRDLPNWHQPPGRQQELEHDHQQESPQQHRAPERRGPSLGR